MTYQREIPRDLFNEANLLKCLGQISLIAHDRPDGELSAVTLTLLSAGLTCCK